MIKKIDRDFGQGYYNILQLTLLAIVNEIIIVGMFFGIYNELDHSINYRKLVWWGLLISVILTIVVSIISTCGLIWYKLV